MARNIWKVLCVSALLLVMLSVGNAAEQDFVFIDPSGGWNSQIGSLSLMLAGDALSFSYSAVFGPTAHICDGAGVASLVTNYQQVTYEYEDEDGNTLIFLITGDNVRMEPLSESTAFCGSGWQGDVFTKDGYQPLENCIVSAERAHFYVVDKFPPEKRKAYVIAGDPVEVAPVRNEGGDDFVLARFKGAKSVTVGFMHKNDLDCSK